MKVVTLLLFLLVAKSFAQRADDFFPDEADLSAGVDFGESDVAQPAAPAPRVRAAARAPARARVPTSTKRIIPVQPARPATPNVPAPQVTGTRPGDALMPRQQRTLTLAEVRAAAEKNAVKSLSSNAQPPLRAGRFNRPANRQVRAAELTVDTTSGTLNVPIVYPWTYYLYTCIPLMAGLIAFFAVLIFCSAKGPGTGLSDKAWLLIIIPIATVIVTVIVALSLFLGAGRLALINAAAPSSSTAERSSTRSQTFGGTAADNANLEALAHQLASVLEGRIVVQPGGSQACPRPRLCGGDGTLHGGIFFPFNCEGFAAYTACTSAGLNINNAARGSAMMHEVMHMYEQRLVDRGFLPQYTAITQGQVTKDNYFDEQLTDALTFNMGGKWLYYGLTEPRNTWAKQLLQQFPVADYPWAPPLGQAASTMVAMPPNPPSVGARLVPIAPARFLDSRNFGNQMPLGAGNFFTLQVAGQQGVDADATGAILNLVAVEPRGPGYLTVYPNSGPAPPLSSVQNYVAGDVVAGAVVTSLAGGGANIFSMARTHIVIDVSAFFSTRRGDLFVPTTPTRAYDSRSNGGRYSQGQQRTITIPGLPADATAVAMSVTAVNPAADGFVTLYQGACQATPPVVSTVNYKAGQAATNFAIMPLSGGQLCAYAFRELDLIFDVTGYLSATSGSLFYPIMPQRLMDTRTGGEGIRTEIKGRMQPGAILTLPLAGSAASDARVTAVSLSVTAVDTSAGGFISVFPCDAGNTNTGAVSYGANTVRPSPIMVRVSAAKTVCFVSSAATDLVVDLSGFFM